MKVAPVVALAVVLSGALATAAEPPALDSAVKAVRELRYPQARAELDALLKAGGHPRDRFVEILALHAEVVAVMDGPDAGERAFRRLLVIDPQHAPPSRRSPVVATPFERARKWVAANGALQVTA